MVACDAPSSSRIPNRDIFNPTSDSQGDLLESVCERNGAEWNIIRPATIIGALSRASMNTFYPFASYAIVQVWKWEPITSGREQWPYE